MRLCRVLSALLALTAPLYAGPVTSWDDISFWVGDGTNRAVLAIDWDGADDADEALVWGYRWNGEATGAQMLLDVVASDPWLYTRVGSDPLLGLGVWGLGYDSDQDGLFGIDDGTAFGVDGIAETPRSDGAIATDPGDLYREGWFRAYWHYGLGRIEAGEIAWTTSSLGAGSVMLSDGDWNSYAIAQTLNYDEFAENLVASTAPPSVFDFNSDGVIDAADYTQLRDAGGVSAQFVAWANAYGTTVSVAQSIPEPSALLLLLFTTSLFCNPLERV